MGRLAAVSVIVTALFCGVAAAPWERRALAAERYAVVEALFLQRDNETNDTDLVFDGDTTQPVIGTPDLRFPVASGLRLFVGRHEEGERGWEVGYLGVYGMSADADAAADGLLEIAPTLSSQVASLRGASLAQVSYGSTINGAEVNLLATSEHVHRPRFNAYAADRIPFHGTVDWLAGFRWAGLEEQAAITLTTPDLAPSQYGVHSSSNLFGGQIGVRGRIDWQRWSIEGWGKACLAGAALAQSQAPVVDAISGEVYRSARGRHRADVGGIFDWNVSVVRRIDETWSMHAGYTMLWLTGVALAPDQFDFSSETDAGTGLVAQKAVWLQGATVGMQARW
jgi:hypothetical protein